MFTKGFLLGVVGALSPVYGSAAPGNVGLRNITDLFHPEAILVDPCKTFCAAADAGDCSTVHARDGICANLAYGPGGRLRVSFSKLADVHRVTTSEAFAAVSTGSCDNACNATPACKSSFCKPNGHCQSLFWDDLRTATLCFHDGINRCRVSAPLLCTPSIPKTASPTVSMTKTEADGSKPSVQSTITGNPPTKMLGTNATSAKTTSTPSRMQANEQTTASNGANASSVAHANPKSGSNASLQSNTAGTQEGTIVRSALLCIIALILV